MSDEPKLDHAFEGTSPLVDIVFIHGLMFPRSVLPSTLVRSLPWEVEGL